MNIDNLETILSDVTPIPQDDGPSPVCAIAYSSDFTKAMDYFRAILKADERSERDFELTTLCLKFNPANYTVWHYRRRCLASICHKKTNTISGESEKIDDDNNYYYDPQMVKEELKFTERLGGSNPKNYQIWYHRHALLEPQFSSKKSNHDDEQTLLSLAQHELDYIANVLSHDPKNYHAWSHRQWTLSIIDNDILWNKEKDYIHELIADDPRNNSAWNQRWFVSHRGKKLKLSEKSFDEEGAYAMKGAEIDPHNESPWRYLIGIIKEQIHVAQSLDFSISEKIASYEEQIEKIIDDLKVKDIDPNTCVNMVSAHIDILQMKGDMESLSKGVLMAKILQDEDTIRSKYWTMRQEELISLIG